MEIRKAARVNKGRPGMSSAQFRACYARLTTFKFRVGIFSLYAGATGNLASTNYYSAWVHGLREQGIDVFWMAPYQTKKPEIDLGFIDGPILRAPYKEENFSQQRVIDEEKPRMILLHNNPLSMDFLEESTLGGVLKLVFVGDALTHRIKDPSKRHEHIDRIIKNVDGLIVVSEFLKNTWISYGFNPEKIFVTKTPVDAQAWPTYRGSGTASKAGYFGNIYHKEIDNLLEIVPLVRDAIPSFTLTIYGDGAASDMRNLRNKIIAKGLEGIVVLHESVSLKEMQQIQSGLDVLLLPREKAEFSDAGFPNKLGEYLASGCPAVVTDISGISQVLTDGEHLSIVGPNDNLSFARAIIDCLQNYHLAVERARKGKKWVETHVSPKVVAGTFLDWAKEV